MLTTKRNLRSEFGAVSMEAVIVLPILFILVFGAVEYAMVLNQKMKFIDEVRKLGRKLEVLSIINSDPVLAEAEYMAFAEASSAFHSADSNYPHPTIETSLICDNTVGLRFIQLTVSPRISCITCGIGFSPAGELAISERTYRFGVMNATLSAC